MALRARMRLAAALLGLLPACGGGGTGGTNPAGPSTASQAASDIALAVISPASGATVSLRDCPFNGQTPICTTEISGTLTARFERALPQATVLLDFFTNDQRRCAASLTTPPVDLTAGTNASMSFGIVVGSVPPQLPQFCSLPVTTTRIVATLLDGSSNPVFTRDFARTYTFTRGTGTLTGTSAPALRPLLLDPGR